MAYHVGDNMTVMQHPGIVGAGAARQLVKNSILICFRAVLLHSRYNIVAIVAEIPIICYFWNAFEMNNCYFLSF